MQIRLDLIYLIIGENGKCFRDNDDDNNADVVVGYGSGVEGVIDGDDDDDDDDDMYSKLRWRDYNCDDDDLFQTMHV